MDLDRRYLACGLAYAVVGMGLGVYMGVSHDHGQHITHAHILLVGFVVSLIYGIVHRLWLGQQTGGVGTAQFIVHQVGAVAMVSGLFLLYGEFVPEETIGPFLGIASITVLLGALLMLTLVLKSNTART